MAPFLTCAFVCPKVSKLPREISELTLQRARWRNTIVDSLIRSRFICTEEMKYPVSIICSGSGSDSDSSSAVYSSAVSFSCPLVEAGYPPAVAELTESESESKSKSKSKSMKPLLLYLPGFDGTLVAPFLQFPELGTEFDVRGMTVAMEDRSTLIQLRDYVLDYIYSAVDCQHDIIGGEGRPIYIMGESFGGILALEVAIAILNTNININLQGLVLINPATSYNQSQLAINAPPLTKIPTLLYPIALLTLLPLFTDSYALPQLLLMLQSKALPSIIDTPQREAYMGRTAFSLPYKLKFMPQSTLQWRLHEWLTIGCESINQQIQTIHPSDPFHNLPILLVVGQNDRTLPSVSEAQRLATILPNVRVEVVPGAGHASTSGTRVDLTALMRRRFPRLGVRGGRTRMKEVAATGEGDYFGMEPRYDGALFGLSPLVYWAEENYRRGS